MSKDYKETLNLPQGGISMKANLSNKAQSYFNFGMILIYITI